MTEPTKLQNADNPITRVWCDGCYDLVHFGHANSLRQAKALGDYLIVGVHTDEEIAKHKRPPVLNFAERCKMVAAIKWVDEVVEGSPYVTTLETLDQHNCEFCCHGDDITLTQDGDDTYTAIKQAQRYREVQRTPGISTTGLVDKILATYQNRSTAQGRSPWTGNELYLTTRKIVEFADYLPPSPEDVVIYVSGSFDMFHVGHLAFLEKARELGNYLLVGLFPDEVVSSYKGPSFPIMNLNERLLCVLACKYVSNVVIGAPYLVTKEFMRHFAVDVVVDGTVSVKDASNFGDPYKYPKQAKKFIRLNSGSDMTTDKIIERVLKNRLEYEEGNEKKEKKEIDWLNELENRGEGEMS